MHRRAHSVLLVLIIPTLSPSLPPPTFSLHFVSIALISTLFAKGFLCSLSARVSAKEGGNLIELISLHVTNLGKLIHFCGVALQQHATASVLDFVY